MDEFTVSMRRIFTYIDLLIENLNVTNKQLLLNDIVRYIGCKQCYSNDSTYLTYQDKEGVYICITDDLVYKLISKTKLLFINYKIKNFDNMFINDWEDDVCHILYLDRNQYSI